MLFCLLFSSWLSSGNSQLDVHSPWPSWGCDAAGTGLSQYNSRASVIAGPVGIAWSFEPAFIGQFDAPPAIDSSGAVYVHSSAGYLYALDGLSGSSKWQYTYGSNFPSNSPAIDVKNRLFAILGGTLFAFDAPSGVILWSTAVSSASDTPSVALDAFGRVISAGNSSNAVAFNCSSGIQLWSFSLCGRVYTSFSIDSSGRIFFGTSDGMCALDATGNFLWRYTTATSSYPTSPPSVDSRGRVVFGAADSRVYALNGTTGALLWWTAAGSPVSGLAIDDSLGRIFFSASANVSAWNGNNGTLIWSVSGGSSHAPSIDTGGNLFVSREGALYAMDAATGRTLWNLVVTFDTKFSTPSIDSLGHVFVGSRKGVFYSISIMCPAGYEIDSLTSKCAKCYAGRYSADFNTACGMCPSGFYCPSPGANLPIACPPGSSCPLGCRIPAGFSYSDPSLVLCSAGSYCPADVHSTPLINIVNTAVTACPAHSYCPTGASAPIKCPIGSFGGYLGLSTQFCAGLCPVGSYGITDGAASEAMGCAACPNGTTTVSPGSTSRDACASGAFLCPAFYEPIVAVPAAASDCAPLSCPKALQPAADGRGCVGNCSVGQVLAQLPTGLSCLPCPLNFVCPGFNLSFLAPQNDTTSRTSAAATAAPMASMLLPQGLGGTASTSSGRRLDPTCALLSSAQLSQTPSAAAPSALAAAPLSPAIIAVTVISSLLGIAVVIATFVSTSTGLGYKYMAAVDMFSLRDPAADGESPRRVSSAVGGMCSVMALVVICSVALILIIRQHEDNALSVSSVSILSAASQAALLSVDLSEAKGGGSLPVLSGLFIAIQSLASLGACATPIRNSLSWSVSGGSGWSVAASVSNCGDGTSLLLLACPSCEFSTASSVTLQLPYTCQALGLSALAIDAGGGIAIATLPIAATSSNGTLLTGLSWSISPVTSIIFDEIASSTKRGYQLIPLTSMGSYLDPSTPIFPLTSVVSLTFPTPLQSFSTVTTISQKATTLQLLSSIVGLAGILGLFRLFRKGLLLVPSKLTPLRAAAISSTKASGWEMHPSPIIPQESKHNGEYESIKSQLLELERRLAALKNASQRSP